MTGRSTTAKGPSLPKWAVQAVSAFPPIATIERTCQEVRFVPWTEVPLNKFNHAVNKREKLRGGKGAVRSNR